MTAGSHDQGGCLSEASSPSSTSRSLALPCPKAPATVLIHPTTHTHTTYRSWRAHLEPCAVGGRESEALGAAEAAQAERGFHHQETHALRSSLKSNPRQHNQHTTSSMRPLLLLPLLGAAALCLRASEAFVLRPLPSSAVLRRSPCCSSSRAGTSKRSVAYQDSQNPRKSQQPHVNDKNDDSPLLDLEGKFYQWKHGPVHYVQAGAETASAGTFPVLLLPGTMRLMH